MSSLLLNVGIFVVAVVAICLAGTRLAKVADQIADHTGWGEAVVGALFLGGSTSLSGIVTSITAAWQGHPSLAVSNAIGGIAAQTVFLAIADLTYRRANLEHAAASVANLMQGTLMILLLTIPLVANFIAPVTLAGAHLASPVLIVTYGLGLRMVSRAKTHPMWGAKKTSETRFDIPSPELNRSLKSLWFQFLPLAIIIGFAGYGVAQSGVAIANQTGLSETLVGGLFTSVSTSLPELITSVAAVRQGALILAVSDIIGGNCFDVLFLAFSDIAYRQGSIYHAITDPEKFMIALTILMTGILLLGLLRRERYGIGNIGFESFLILVLYVAGLIVLFL